MKKTYSEPQAEVEKFSVNAGVITCSTDPSDGQGGNNNNGGDAPF